MLLQLPHFHPSNNPVYEIEARSKGRVGSGYQPVPSVSTLPAMEGLLCFLWPQAWNRQGTARGYPCATRKALLGAAPNPMSGHSICS